MAKYTIGIDFGSLSGRAALVDIRTGQTIATSIFEYPHAVMDRQLPDGTLLPKNYALQHPQDFLDALVFTINEVMRLSGVDKENVIGLGLDVTACTVLPVDKEGTPLCFRPQFSHVPDAYIKMWKHHGAQNKADRMTAVAEERGEPWLARFGGRVSSENAFPKLWEVLEKAPEVYEAMYEYMEVADWLVWQLTGNPLRNSCAAGYKAYYHHKTGYPSKEFLAALDPRLENAIAEKMPSAVVPIGSKAGELTETMAKKLGLSQGTAVACGMVDAHACVPAVGITSPGQLLMIIGTSACHMVLGKEDTLVPGICGSVYGGILPGYTGYEAGQSCVGDMLAWFINNCVPSRYFDQAAAEGMDIHQYLSELASRAMPGESGLIALDWWNGNRSTLSDFNLSGTIMGMTLQTKCEEIYRALIEAAAFGTRMIVENYREHGVSVDEFFASGGISRKNPMAMQIYADVLNMPVHIADSEQGPALGSAIFGAVAAGKASGGYDSVYDAIAAMSSRSELQYEPDPECAVIYEELFRQYKRLYDYFGRGGNNIMKKLHTLRKG